MRTKTYFLLLIFLLGLIPNKLVRAEQKITRSADTAITFLYISDAILQEEVVDDEISSVSKVSSQVNPELFQDLTTEMYNRMVHATKMQRNEHDKKCQQTEQIYRQQGKTCEADQTKSYCKAKRAEYTAKIAELRKLRGGDLRNPFTKGWHSLKRAGAKFWHRIGPLGRKFLREVGPQALKIVAAGGPGSEAFLKNLLKHTAKKMARERAKQIGLRALQRILKVQIDISAAAGVDICKEDDKDESEDTTQATATEDTKNKTKIDLPTTGIWNLNCRHTWQPVLDDYGEVPWSVNIYWEQRTFEGVIEAKRTTVDGARTETWHWPEEGNGSITEDGFFWGDFVDSKTLTVSYEGGNTHTYDHGYDQKWIGAISEDLSKVCFTRVGAREWLTIDWLRERGRNEMLNAEGALCEAVCPGP